MKEKVKEREEGRREKRGVEAGVRQGGVKTKEATESLHLRNMLGLQLLLQMSRAFPRQRKNLVRPVTRASSPARADLKQSRRA
eukprot:442993-Hanusia_phi.AAC.2